jgi:DNA polymerase-3 subunit delta'
MSATAAHPAEVLPLEALPGQHAAVQTLRAAMAAGRMPHALLLHGADGLGALPFARALAADLLCAGLPPQAFDTTQRKVARLEHPDLHIVLPIISKTTGGTAATTAEFLEQFRPILQQNPYLSLNRWSDELDAANKQLFISIHEIRSLIQRLALSAYEGSHKVVIIWHAEKMNNEASNALLKLLEEPPAGTFLILTAESPAQILPTVISRCQLVPLQRIPAPEIAAWLQQQGTEPDTADELSRLADGNLSRALELGAHSQDSYYEAFSEWLRSCVKWSTAKVSAWADQMGRQPREAQKLFLEIGLQTLHEALLYKSDLATLATAPPSVRMFLERFSQFVHLDALEQIARALEDALHCISRNAYGPLTFYALSRHTWQALQQPASTAAH